MQETFDMIKKFSKDNELRLSAGTLRNYGYVLNCFFADMQKGYREIKTEDVEEWMAGLMEGGIRVSTIAYRLACLKSFYSYLREEGLISENLVSELALPKRGDNIPYYLEREQLQKLRDLVKNDPLERAVVETLYTTGVRVSELIRIRLSDVNWETKHIDIKDGKGKKERTVLFNDECKLWLEEYLKSRCEDSQYLFLGKQGKPMYRFLLNYYFKKYKKKLGIKITPNTMRHTFAAHLAENGMPLRHIQVLLGHDNPETTRIYTKLYSHVRKKKYDRYI